MITKDTNFAVDMSPARLEWPIYNFPLILKPRQRKCEKGTLVKYKSLELNNYLKPCANISLEDQQLLFALICEIDYLLGTYKWGSI